MPVGALHHQPYGHAVALSQQAALDPPWRDRSDSARFFPPRGALVIAPSMLSQLQSRPCSSSNWSTPAGQSFRRRSLRPMPETGRGRWIWHITRSDSGLPIGSPCEARRTWPRHSGDPVRADGRRQSGGYSPAPGAAARGRPIAHRKYGTQWLCGCWACAPAFVWVIVISSCLQYTRLFG